MKGNEKVIVLRIVVAVTALLFALSTTSYAAPAAAAKSTQQAKPAATATGATAASLKYDPNAPPQGSITITAPQSGKVWNTGSYQVIEWTNNGTRTNAADVTLWRNNQQFAVVWTGSATGRTAYIVPFGTAPGSYELRVTNEGDTRIEARVPVTIATTSLTLQTPQAALLSGSPYTITWSYTGGIPSLKLAILDSAGAVVQEITNVSAGTNGNGVWPWTVPFPPAGKTSVQYRFRISGVFHTDVTNNALSDVVLATSDLFNVRLPKVEVGSFLLKANVAQCSPGRTYQINWTSELNGKQVKVELYKTYAGTVVQTIQSSVPSQATNSISWTVPAIPETQDRTQYLNVRVTSLDYPAVKGEGDVFNCDKPWISLTSPDPNQNLNMNQAYQIAWQYGGDPGPHVKVDLMTSKQGGYNLQVFETPAQSAAMQGSTGKWGQGGISWTLTNKGPQSQFYIQLTGVENSNVYDRKQYYIAYGSGSSGTVVSGTTTTGSTGTSGTSGSSSTSTSSSSSSSSSTGSTSQKMLTNDTSIKYNSLRSATFKGGTTVNLDGNGYAVNGYLSLTDQSIDYNSGKSVQIYGGSYVTFAGGYVTSGYLAMKGNQYLDYRSGKSAQFYGGAMTKFSNGYVASSILAMTNQTLEYGSGRSAQFYGGSGVAFSNGYVLSGTLTLNGQSLYYSSGKTASFMAGSGVVFRSSGYVKSAFLGIATTFATTKGTQAVPALSYVTFDDNGYLASFNPPGFSACYKCDTQTDPNCSNNGGLPLCPPGK